jgi:hypothetical protein
MPFVYEVNGQRVEFEKEPTQADIDEAAAAMAPPVQAEVAEPNAMLTAPAVAGYGFAGPTGLTELGQTARAAISPYAGSISQGLKNTVDVYKARPILAPAIEALGVATMGVPPIAAGQQALSAYDKYQAVKQGLTGAGQELSKGQATKDAYNAMQRALYQNDPTNFRRVISSTYGPPTNVGVPAGPGNNAVRSLLGTAEAQAAMSANPQFAQAAGEYLKTVPTYGQQAMKVVGPALKGAARVVGPAGMAYNMYEAGQMARNTELGQRLQQGQGQQAEQAFRNMNTQYGQQLNPQEAQNVLAGGSARDIAAFGGRDRLNMQMRVQAAKRVLGQQQ